MVLERDCGAPSKFIGYEEMKGNLYIDKAAVIDLDGRETVNTLKKYFTSMENENLQKYVSRGKLEKILRLML